MSRISIKGIAGGPKRLSRLLKASVGVSDSDGGKEEDHWVVGGRYRVLQPTALHASPDLSSEKLGQVRAKDTVLLLALQSAPAQSSSGEVLLAYVANTKNPEWVAGWGQIEGNTDTGAPSAPVLRRRRLHASWEVGGRYIVNGSPVLRSRIELESEQMVEIHANEEVLVLDLGLVIRSGQPRLRARARTDAGDHGWLTIELPGGSALLEPLNLYSAEALQRKSSIFGEKHRKLGLSNRVTLNGQSESSNQAWEIGGKYRLVERVVVYEEADLNSRVFGELKKGSLVQVRSTDHFIRPADGVAVLRLQISNEHTTAIGWLSPLSQNGEKLLDSRDHLEFDKLMRLQLLAQEQDQAQQEAAPNLQEVAYSPPEAPTETVVPALDAPVPLAAPWQEVDNFNPMGMDYSSPGLGAAGSMHAEEAYPSNESARNSPQAFEEVRNSPQAFAPISPQVSPHFESPNIALMSAHAMTGEAEAVQRARVDNKLNSGHNMDRPYDYTQSAYRTLDEMDSEKDERQVGDNLENEGFLGICSCRNGLLSCGASKAWTAATKVMSAGAPYPANHGMMGEPAPEPRPTRQMPSPPGVHATARPKDSCWPG